MTQAFRTGTICILNLLTDLIKKQMTFENPYYELNMGISKNIIFHSERSRTMKKKSIIVNVSTSLNVKLLCF